MRLPTGPNLTPTPLFNPDIVDYTYYQAEENGDKTPYTLPALDIVTLPKYLADRFANELANTLLQKRGIKHNAELDKSEILKEILIVL